MAAYDYRCAECGVVFEVRRPVTADARDARCPDGHAEVTRLWSAVALSSGAPSPTPAASGCCGGGCCG